MRLLLLIERGGANKTNPLFHKTINFSKENQFFNKRITLPNKNPLYSQTHQECRESRSAQTPQTRNEGGKARQDSDIPLQTPLKPNRSPKEHPVGFDPRQVPGITGRRPDFLPLSYGACCPHNQAWHAN